MIVIINVIPTPEDEPDISNPDLIERFKTAAPLAPLNRTTLYGGRAEGYTDYPTLNGWTW